MSNAQDILSSRSMQRTQVPQSSATNSRDSRADALAHAFSPSVVAVIGASATRGKWSNDVFRLLAHNFRGTLIPVNPQRDAVEGIRCYPTIAAVPEKIDYAIVVVERDAVLGVVQDCVAAKVPVLHVLSAGFAEVPGVGSDLQKQLVRTLEGSETVLIGPNSMGSYSARAGLAFSWGCHFEHGPVSFISQSGGLCYDMLMRGQARGLRFSKILSVGNCADLDWPDFIRYCAKDPDTGVIALYIESVTDGQRLLEELRAAAKVKPVVVLKGGKTQYGSASVVSHTGRLAGEYDLWVSMLRQAGVFEVGSLDELLIALEAQRLATEIMSSEARPTGLSTMVMGTGGGATVLIADACESADVVLARLEERTIDALTLNVPGAASLGGIGNPLDVGADRLLADPGLLARLTDLAFNDPNVGTVLIHLNMIAVANNLAGGMEAWKTTCEKLTEACRDDKMVCLVLRNGDGGDAADELQRYAVKHLRGRRGLAVSTDLNAALLLIRQVGEQIAIASANKAPVRSEPRTDTHSDHSVSGMIDGAEARALVESFGVEMSSWRVTSDVGAALAAAEALGFPLAVKSAAKDVAHKSDVGCVQIGIETPEALRRAYHEISNNARLVGSATPELILVERMAKGSAEIVIGLKRSETFGASIVVGLGGIWVELLHDSTSRLCPVDYDEALQMLSELRGLPILTGGRGRPKCDLPALAKMIVDVSRLGAAREDIVELDLNPVMVMEEGRGAVAVDARVVLTTNHS